jgi:colicin import membrane protein
MTGSSLDRDFNRNFLISLGIHFLLALLAYAMSTVLVKFFKNQDVEIIRSSVRVDVVGMPKFTIQELREMQKEALPLKPSVPEESKGAKSETKADSADVIKKGDVVIQEETKKKSSFLNLISDYSKKKIDIKDSKKGVNNGKSSLENLILEGNRLSKGSALVGDYSDTENTAFSSYVQTLPELVRVHWKLPSYLLDKNLRCRIRMFISSSGQLIKVELHESSGQSEFDARAEKAIRDSAPFPKPEPEVASRLTGSGIILGFPL